MRSLNEFLQLRKLTDCASNAPLSVNYNCAILSREAFIDMLRHLLSILNLNDSKHLGHSFEIGAAPFAAAAGIEDHVTNTLGRWSSNCYTRYA